MSSRRPSALWRAWARTAAEAPDRLALAETGADSGLVLTWTRAELDRHARDLAAGPFRDAGGRRVALCGPNSAPWVAAFLALQLRGASAVLLDAGTPVAGRPDAARAAGADWLFSIESRDREPAVTALRNRRAAGRDEVCVKLTSGSTGVPKRIPCAAGHLLADGRQVAATMGIGARDRALGLIPLGHAYAVGSLVMPLLLHGTTLVAVPAFVPGQIPAWLAAHRITVFPGVPALFRILAALPGELPATPALRLVVSAGAPLAPETARAFAARFGKKARIRNHYGSSETGGIAFDRTGRATLDGSSVGTPLEGVRVEIAKGRRLRVTSPAVATRSGSFLLPDLGAWTEEGGLRIVGRAGTVANIGGKKVYPAEVEAALRALPGVAEAWVGAGRDPKGDYLAAAVETALPAAEVRRRLGAVLPEWKRPRVVECFAVGAFPRTGRGKADSAQLRARLGLPPAT